MIVDALNETGCGWWQKQGSDVQTEDTKSWGKICLLLEELCTLYIVHPAGRQLFEIFTQPMTQFSSISSTFTHCHLLSWSLVITVIFVVMVILFIMAGIVILGIVIIMVGMVIMVISILTCQSHICIVFSEYYHSPRSHQYNRYSHWHTSLLECHSNANLSNWCKISTH